MYRNARAGPRGEFSCFCLSKLEVEGPPLQTFEENSTLEGILGELILPAVKSKELSLREKGLVSLGLCCLIARVNQFHGIHLTSSQHLYLLHIVC